MHMLMHNMYMPYVESERGHICCGLIDNSVCVHIRPRGHKLLVA